MVKFKKVLHFSTYKAEIKKDIERIHSFLDNYQSYSNMQDEICCLAKKLWQNNPHGPTNLLESSLKIKREQAIKKTIVACINAIIIKAERKISAEKSHIAPFTDELRQIKKIKERLKQL